MNSLAPNPEFAGNSHISDEANDGAHAEILIAGLGGSGHRPGGILMILPVVCKGCSVARGRCRGSQRRWRLPCTVVSSSSRVHLQRQQRLLL